MNIVGARITTSRGGIAIDSFRIGHQEQLERVLEPERWERVQQLLAKVLRGQIDIAAQVAASGRPSILEKPTQASTMPATWSAPGRSPPSSPTNTGIATPVAEIGATTLIVPIASAR